MVQIDVNENSISFEDILNILLKNFWVIILSAVIGLTLSIAYLALSPSNYIGIAKVSMAKVGEFSDAAPLVGRGIEEPLNLINRLESDTRIIDNICKGDLVNEVTYSAPKGSNETIEIAVYSSTKEGAESCAKSIFEFIDSSQSSLINSYFDSVNILIAKEEAALREYAIFLKKSSNTGISELVNQSEGRLRKLNNIQSSFYRKNAVLLSGNPVSINTPSMMAKFKIIGIGFLAGLGLGLIIAFSRHFFRLLSCNYRAID